MVWFAPLPSPAEQGRPVAGQPGHFGSEGEYGKCVQPAETVTVDGKFIHRPLNLVAVYSVFS